MNHDLQAELPPGQQLCAAGKWPVVGERTARNDSSPWTVTVSGLVAHPLTLSLAEIQASAHHELTVDIHCVSRWSKLGVRFRGILLEELLTRAGSLDEARFVSLVARSDRLHSTSLELADALELRTLIAVEADGQPLKPVHGGPVRVVVPGRYFYKSLKWLERIEVLAEDRLGYWEADAGYHNIADPWLEQRFIAPSITKQEAARLIAGRDFSGRDLRGIDASGRDLAGLNARGALLRDADFRGANLQDACLVDANLSLAHFNGADLRGADLTGADCEGTDFAGADLRGTKLRALSLFGASFTDERTGQSATLDATTDVDPALIDNLTPDQSAFIRKLGLG